MNINQHKKKRAKAKGLGDTIAEITKATGIDKVVKWIAGEDCGCLERQERLNQLFPYKTECLTESEFEILDDYFKRNTDLLTNIQQKQMLKIYNRVFNKNQQITSCSPCARKFIRELKDLHLEYKRSEIQG